MHPVDANRRKGDAADQFVVFFGNQSKCQIAAFSECINNQMFGLLAMRGRFKSTGQKRINCREVFFGFFTYQHFRPCL